MIQEILVITILAAVVAFVVYKVYNALKGRRESPCDDCAGCVLKEQLRGVAFDCTDRKTHKKR